MQNVESKINWKAVLVTVGGVILLITLVYSNYLASSLKNNERDLVEIWLKALERVGDDNAPLDQDLGFELAILDKFNIPAIIEYEDGTLEGNNFSNEDEEFLKKKIREFNEKGLSPIEGSASKVYYFKSQLFESISLFPIVQILLVGLFVWLGYFILNLERKSEQNRVWVGLAKETAHQLGTPISAILAWVEHLKEYTKGKPDQEEILNEMVNDVSRLELVADRFSKIGSAPDLKETHLRTELGECINYMQRRAPRRVQFEDLADGDEKVKINQHLFDWVIENLYRNALDAMDGQGQISTEVYTENDYVCIDVTDTGKGIPNSKFKSVFDPGFSTKERGWGLGLSLAKRIIENYHKGKIFVKKSKINEGTTFTVKLPKV